MATKPLPVAPWGEYVPRVGPMTVEQFEAFPAEEGWEYELHEGRLIAMPGPGDVVPGFQCPVGALMPA